MIKIYKYLSAKYALRCLETAELKVSTVDSMNDPFELSPHFTVSDPSDPEKCEVAQISIDSYWQTMRRHGIICMSAHADDPAVWSHYAEAHTGVVLEFSHPDNDALFEVRYPSERMSVHADELIKDFKTYEAFIKKVCSQKAPSWHYEKEYRIYVQLDNCTHKGNLYFYPLPCKMMHRVILGAKCDLSEKDVQLILDRQKWDNMKVTRAQLSKENFTVEV
ncbi:DUF2971 domain-containing protein [Verrucomicrobiota bacterium]